MRVWLVQPAEPMPIEKGNNRLWRTGYTAKLLNELGHDVVWWASNFSHTHKRFRKLDGDTVLMSEHYRIRFLKALGYKRNISLARLKDHRFVAQQFAIESENEPEPDIILASFPTIETCVEVVNYGKRHHIPVVIDVRDQWPDVFYDILPGPLRGLAKLGTIRYSKHADYIFKNATAITGNAWGAVEFGLKRAGRMQNEYDLSVPMAYDPPVHTKEDLKRAAQFWDTQNLPLKSDAFIATFAGAIGFMFDIDTIVDAASMIHKSHPQILIVLAGDGATFDQIKIRADRLPNIWMPGRIGSPELSLLFKHSKVGLAPYLDLPNFTRGFTNKPIEYLAAGLPVVTPLKTGEMADILNTHGAGLFYNAKDPSSLALAICQMADDMGRLETMSKAALELFEDLFQARKVYGDMVDHLQMMVDRHKSGALKV